MLLRHNRDLPWSEVSHNAAIKKQVLLSSGEVPHLTQFAHSVFKPGQVAPAHSHKDMTEVFLVTSGTLTASINGKIHTLPTGSLLTIEPGEVHELSNQDPSDLHLTYFGILT